MNRRSIRAVTAALAGAAALLVVLTSTGTATADPTSTPGQPPAGAAADIYAGVGADAFAELTNTVAVAYNGQATKPAHTLASYDAVNPTSGAAMESITTKPGCSLLRPNGAGAGLKEIAKNLKSTSDSNAYCIDFVRSSRSRDDTVAAEAKLTFYAQSLDAVSYATVGNAYAPVAPLTTEQLTGIFQCEITDWSQVGGQPGAIHLYLPPATAATYTFFLQAINTNAATVNSSCAGTTPGTLNNRVYLNQQNDGRTLAGDPQGIAPYTVTKWAAQDNEPVGIVDLRGGAQIGLVNSTTSPFTTQTVEGTAYRVLNPQFATGNSVGFGRTFYNVVRSADAPADLRAVFTNGGFLCKNADKFLIPYGNTPLGDNLNADLYCGKPF